MKKIYKVLFLFKIIKKIFYLFNIKIEKEKMKKS